MGNQNPVGRNSLDLSAQRRRANQKRRAYYGDRTGLN
jgi:hypothetical protein